MSLLVCLLYVVDAPASHATRLKQVAREARQAGWLVWESWESGWGEPCLGDAANLWFCFGRRWCKWVIQIVE